MPSRMRQTLCANASRPDEDRWLYGPAVTATMEEIRYAERLRHMIRARFARHAATPSVPWTVGVD